MTQKADKQDFEKLAPWVVASLIVFTITMFWNPFSYSNDRLAIFWHNLYMLPVIIGLIVIFSIQLSKKSKINKMLEST